MNIGIMQPYFLPYLGYWQLIKAVDIFVIYDDIKYTKKGWFHRNNFLLNGNKQLFSLPIKNDSDFLNVCERKLSDDRRKHIEKILRQIHENYNSAPYYDELKDFYREIFFDPENNLFKYIYNSIVKLLNILKIETKVIISSSLEFENKLSGVSRVLAICEKLNSTKYTNAIGGQSLYCKDQFLKNKIQLEFLDSKLPSYPQTSENFVQSLSIMDIMFNVGAQATHDMLNDYTIIS